MKRIPPATALALVLALVAIAPSSAANPKTLPADHPFLGLLANSSVERGREYRALLVVPIALIVPQPAGERPLTSAEAVAGKHLSLGEPENKEGRFQVEAFNWSTKPILLVAGELFEGGHRDRFLGRDVLLRPGASAIAPVYPADIHKRKRDARKKTLLPLDVVAPPYPRFVTVFTGMAAKALSFISNGYALTGDQHPRKPFPHLLKSAKLATRLGDYRNQFAKIPDEAEKRTVGVAAWVGDRLAGIDIFSSNTEFRAHWPKILHALAFQASLYEVANGLVKHPFPAGRDPDRRRTELKALLKKLFAARAYFRDAVDLGREIRLVRDGLTARVLMLDDRLVHALLMPDLRAALADAAPPRTGTAPELTFEELNRRASRSRLTEYERRLLERMQNRRRTPGNRTPPREPDLPVVPVPPRDSGNGGAGR